MFDLFHGLLVCFLFYLMDDGFYWVRYTVGIVSAPAITYGAALTITLSATNAHFICYRTDGVDPDCAIAACASGLFWRSLRDDWLFYCCFGLGSSMFTTGPIDTAPIAQIKACACNGVNARRTNITSAVFSCSSLLVFFSLFCVFCGMYSFWRCHFFACWYVFLTCDVVCCDDVVLSRSTSSSI